MSYVKLAPSILSADFANLARDVKEVKNAGAHYLHVDVMDGHFVPNISIGAPVVKSLRKATDMVLDVHLMIDDPRKYIDDFIDAGADILNFHVEAVSDVSEVSAMAKYIRKKGVKAGVTIKPKTGVEVIEPILDDVDLVLVMSVNPCFGGQKLILPTLYKTRDLAKLKKERGHAYEIEIDGGVNMSTIDEVLKSGVDIVVAGSAVFEGNIAANVAAFLKKFDNDEK